MSSFLANGMSGQIVRNGDTRVMEHDPSPSTEALISSLRNKEVPFDKLLQDVKDFFRRRFTILLAQSIQQKNRAINDQLSDIWNLLERKHSSQIRGELFQIFSELLGGTMQSRHKKALLDWVFTRGISDQELRELEEKFPNKNTSPGYDIEQLLVKRGISSAKS